MNWSFEAITFWKQVGGEGRVELRFHFLYSEDVSCSYLLLSL